MRAEQPANVLEISPDLLVQVREALLAEQPDLDRLRAALIQELDFSPEDVRELVFEIVLQLNRNLFPPLSHIELVHTEGCNLACSYCFEKNMLGHKRMPPDIIRLAVDLVFAYSGDEPNIQITHFGGEPTMNFEGIQLATEYAETKARSYGKSVDFDMTSNGVLLNEEMVKYFADHNIRVLLSIDGRKSSHDKFRVDKRGRGTFERVLKGLELLKQRQPWIGTKMTVMPENAEALIEDVQGLFRLGVNHFVIGHATGVEWSAEAMGIYEDQLGRLFAWYKENPRDDLRIDDFETVEEGSFFGCQAGRTSVAVSVRGEISPCSKIMGLNSREIIGKLGDVWHGITHLRSRQDLVSCSRLKSACQERGIAAQFEGGCFAVNYGENDDLFVPSLQEHAFTILKRSACAGCRSCSH